MKLPATLTSRRTQTDEKLVLLTQALTEAGAPQIAATCACVYATGSLGRGEMSARSDLDIFVLRDKTVPNPLTNLNEIRLKARLIEVARKLEFPDFSGDGEYIRAHDVKEDLVGKLGTREDDYANVFTARLLLLLESREILGEDVYKQAIETVVGQYWRDYPQNSKSFLPVFLMNDILRFWKTLCLNYEERTGAPRAAAATTGKRRLHNYKLKHSRLLTCYSAIVYLQAVLKRDGGTVSPEAAMQMISASPTKRLEFVATQYPDVEGQVELILENYAKFLDTCDADKAELEAKFSEPNFKKARFDEAREFGDDVSYKLLHLVGADSPILRYLVV